MHIERKTTREKGRGADQNQSADLNKATKPTGSESLLGARLSRIQDPAAVGRNSQGTLHIMSYNINGSSRGLKPLEAEALSLQLGIHVMCFQETKSALKRLNFRNYNYVDQPRPNSTRGGGLGMAIRKGIPFVLHEEWSLEDIIQVVTIYSDDTKQMQTTICNCYAAPGKQQFHKAYDVISGVVNHLNLYRRGELLVVGDFNDNRTAKVPHPFKVLFEGQELW